MLDIEKMYNEKNYCGRVINDLKEYKSKNMTLDDIIKHYEKAQNLYEVEIDKIENLETDSIR